MTKPTTRSRVSVDERLYQPYPSDSCHRTIFSFISLSLQILPKNVYPASSHDDPPLAGGSGYRLLGHGGSRRVAGPDQRPAPAGAGSSLLNLPQVHDEDSLSPLHENAQENLGTLLYCGRSGFHNCDQCLGVHQLLCQSLLLLKNGKNAKKLPKNLDRRRYPQSGDSVCQDLTIPRTRYQSCSTSAQTVPASQKNRMLRHG